VGWFHNQNRLPLRRSPMTLSDEEALWLVNAAKRWRSTISDEEMKNDVTVHIKRIEAELNNPVAPLELLIICPRCFKQHIDEGKFAVEPHKNHSCQFCGLTFQASGQVPSIGVQFFRGYKNDEYKVVPKGDPQISLPFMRPGERMTVIDSNKPIEIGSKVCFKEAARELGYDTGKTFRVISIYHYLEAPSEVLLSGDNNPVPLDLLVCVV